MSERQEELARVKKLLAELQKRLDGESPENEVTNIDEKKLPVIDDSFAAEPDEKKLPVIDDPLAAKPNDSRKGKLRFSGPILPSAAGVPGAIPPRASMASSVNLAAAVTLSTL